MLTEFKFIGASFKKADLSLREAISLNEEESRLLVQDLKEITGCLEILIISTCNRTGIYYNHESSLTDDFLKLLGLRKGIEDIMSFRDSFTEILTHKEAVRHLFRVSMGLESQVIGDIQISNQFKKAYQISADLEACGAFMHRVMHAVFFTNKKVIQETSYRDGTASVSYAAVELANELAGSFREAKILVLGLGEMGADVARNLKGTGHSVTLCNRTWSVAQELALELEFQACKIEDLDEAVINHQIIISAAQVSSPIISKLNFETAEIGLKYFIDLSLPRSIADDVKEIQGTLIYNIDNINNKTSETLKKRKAAIPRVESIIQETQDELATWEQEMEVSPTINKLKNALEEIRKKEIARYVKTMDSKEIEHIESITKGMMQKIIKLPVLQLKAACQRGEAETLIDVLNDLFNLEQEKVTD